MTLTDLTARCEWYQRLLHITDWTVSVRFAGAYDMDGSFGDCTIFEEKQMAAIRLLDPSHAPEAGTRMLDYDPVETLIHELVHIRLYGIDAGAKKATTAEEVAVHQLTQALKRVPTPFNGTAARPTP